MSKVNFLKFAASVNNGFIHSYGRGATKAILNLLNPMPGDNILEIGCGVGFTAISVILLTKGAVKLSATDVLPEMVERAKKNAAFFGVAGKVFFEVSAPGENLPYKDASFDKIFWESVLAIQGPESFDTFLKEAKRLLKPGGTCVMNETIWLEGISQDMVTEINNYNLLHLGLPTSTRQAWTDKDWVAAFTRNGFEVIENTLVEDGINTHNALNEMPALARVKFGFVLFASRALKYLWLPFAVRNYRIKLKMQKFSKIPRHLEARFFVIKVKL